MTGHRRKRMNQFMKATEYRLPARFEEETRFEVTVPSVPSRGEMERHLESLKDRLLEKMLMDAPLNVSSEPLRHAVSEAATLAWMTSFPLLVLPVLAEEKVEAARLKAGLQARIREKSALFMDLAA
jgi:hypothetical protein